MSNTKQPLKKYSGVLNSYRATFIYKFPKAMMLVFDIIKPTLNKKIVTYLQRGLSF